eukprot:3547307-Rhodomonas_salina.2
MAGASQSYEASACFASFPSPLPLLFLSSLSPQQIDPGPCVLPDLISSALAAQLLGSQTRGKGQHLTAALMSRRSGRTFRC